jgi:hypothetical protein
MVQLERIWSKMRNLEVFTLCQLAEFCDQDIPVNLLAAYILALLESGYLVEISGKRKLNHGRYRLLRDSGEFAPILRKHIFVRVMGRFVEVEYAVYDPNIDFFFPLVKEEA